MLSKKGIKINKAVEFKIDDSLLVERICGRLIHQSSGRSYHEQLCPPKVLMKDDITGEPLIRRSDDNEAALKKRLESYHTQTSPVLDYYRKKNILVALDASKSFEQVYNDLLKAIEMK